MNTEKSATIAKRLGILWIILSIALTFAVMSVSTATAIETGGTFFDAKMTWVWIVLGVEAIVLIPLLFFVHHYAKKATMKKYIIAVKILLLHNILCTALLLIFSLV